MNQSSGIGEPTNTNSHRNYATKEDSVHEDYKSRGNSGKEDGEQEGEKTGNAIDEGKDEMGILHHELKMLQTEEGLMLWKAEREIEELERNGCPCWS